VIDGNHAVEARISLSPSSETGLRFSMPSGGRSLLLRFRSLESPDQEITIGAAMCTVDGAALEPGCNAVSVRVWFWADEAQVYATPGAQFRLWYAGRTVGHGKVQRVADEVADSLSR
jgi:hypothetical protein